MIGGGISNYKVEWSGDLHDASATCDIPWQVIQKHSAASTTAIIKKIGYDYAVNYWSGQTKTASIVCQDDGYLDYGSWEGTSTTDCNVRKYFYNGANTWHTVEIGFGGNCTTYPVKYQVLREHKTPQDRIREIISSRSAPAFLRHGQQSDIWNPRKFLPERIVPEKELRARETLRLVVGEEMYRSYLKRGFVTVQNPKSKNVYQIYPGHGLTFVYNNGVMIQRLCVYLKGDFPPTDAMIVRYLMAINNEDQLWKLANKHGPIKSKANVAKFVGLPIEGNLVEIMRELKAKEAA